MPYDEFVGRIARVTKIIPSSGVKGSWDVELVLEDTGERIKALAFSNAIVAAGGKLKAEFTIEIKKDRYRQGY